jgi:hypothetical protein
MGLKLTYNKAELEELVRKDLLRQGYEPLGKINITAGIDYEERGSGKSAAVRGVEVQVRPVEVRRSFGPSPEQISGENSETQADYFGHNNRREGN